MSIVEENVSKSMRQIVEFSGGMLISKGNFLIGGEKKLKKKSR